MAAPIIDEEHPPLALTVFAQNLRLACRNGNVPLARQKDGGNRAFLSLASGNSRRDITVRNRFAHNLTQLCRVTLRSRTKGSCTIDDDRHKND